MTGQAIQGAPCERCGLWVQEPTAYAGKLYGPVCIGKVMEGNVFLSTGSDTAKLAQHYGVSPKIFRRKLRQAGITKQGLHYEFDDAIVEKINELFKKPEKE